MLLTQSGNKLPSDLDFTVEVVRVSRSFGDQEILSDVNLGLRPGEIHGLIGPNGVGKTTLLRIIAGLVTPSGGELRVLGARPGSEDVKRRIGWVPGGDRTFYLRLSGIDNLVFFGRMYGLSKKESAERGTELMELVGLSQAMRRTSGLYSKGMLKRLAVARALLPSPQLLLCDEATHDLDPEGAGSIRDLVQSQADSGLTVVWATQRLDELSSFANSVTILATDGVAFAGSFEELMETLPSRSFSITFTSSITQRAEELLNAAGIRYHYGPDGRMIVDLGSTTPIGRIVADLAEAGFTASTINEVGSPVETAYQQALGSRTG